MFNKYAIWIRKQGRVKPIIVQSLWLMFTQSSNDEKRMIG